MLVLCGRARRDRQTVRGVTCLGAAALQGLRAADALIVAHIPIIMVLAQHPKPLPAS
jgi:hypothetical protein